MMVSPKVNIQDSSVSSRLPYTHFVNPRTVMTKNGDLMGVIKISGADIETKEANKINNLHQLIAVAISELPSDCAVWLHTIRRRIDEECCPIVKNYLSKNFSDYYYKSVNQDCAYTLKFYLCLVLKSSAPIKGRKVLSKISHRLSGHHERVNIGASCKKLDGIASQLCEHLKCFNAKRMKAEDSRATILEPIEYLLNNEMTVFKMPEFDLSSALPRKRLSFGRNLVASQDEMDEQEKYSGLLSFKGYGDISLPGILNPLLKSNQEFVLSQIFQPCDKYEAKELIERHQRQFIQVKDAASTQVDQLSDALDDLMSDKITFGYHTGVLTCINDSIERLNDTIVSTSKCFLEVGLKPVRETTNLESAYWSQFPGNFSDIKRRALISSSNFAAFSNLYAPSKGHQGENHLGRPILPLETPSKERYYFNFHLKGSSQNISLGHTTVIGPSGGGKTTLLCALNCMLNQFSAKSFFFDYRQGMAVYVLASDGIYHTFETGKETGINPIPLDDTPKNRNYLFQFVSALVIGQGETLSSEDEEIISKAIDGVYSVPRNVRNLSSLCAFFNPEWTKFINIKTWLKSEKGGRSYLFDCDNDHLDFDSEIVGVDLTSIMEDSRALLPMMLYLFHKIESGFDGRLHSIVMDEGWQFLNHPYWENILAGWLASFRKENAFVVFATQNPHQVAESKLAYGLIQGAATNIYLANPDATKNDYREAFNLNEREFDIIKNLLPHSYYFLVKQGHHSSVARLNPEGVKSHVSVFSGNQALYKEALALQARYGIKAEQWLKAYMELENEK